MNDNQNNPLTNTGTGNSPVDLSASNMDVPPMPGMVTPPPQAEPTPSANQTPAPVPDSTPQPVASVPPASSNLPPVPPMNGGAETSVVTNKRGGPPKKLILFGLVFVVIILVVFALIKLVLPNLGGSKNVNITWWGLWETPDVVNPLITEYESTHPNVKIQYSQQSKEQYRERLVNTIAKGEGPDIITIHNSWVPMFKNYLSSLPSSVMTAQDFAQTYYSVMTSDMTLGTSLVGIPTGYDGLALYVNDDIFNTYGKTAPKTWNELRDTALSLTIKGENGVITQSGAALGTTSNVDDWQEILALLMLQNGANLNSPTGPLAEGALTFYTNFAKDGVWNDTLPNSTVAFANGKVAMLVAPSWRVHDIKAITPDLKFHLVPVPQLPKNSPDEPDITYATYWVNSVSNKSANQEAAWDFLKFLSTKDSYEKLYQNATAQRAFGEPYPRIDMRDLLAQDQYVGGIISLAGNAKSWYLADKTWDGDTGINSRMSKYFEDAVNAVVDGKDVKSSLSTASQGVLQVLVDYGLATAPASTTAK